MRSTRPTEAPRREAAEEVALRVDHLFRHRSGQMVATLTRVLGFRELDLVEDVVQDALVQALRRWPFTGVPDNPTAWLIQVAKNRALDSLRRRGTWRQKQEQIEAALRETGLETSDPNAGFDGELRDDTLRMIFACCHPSLSRDAQVALTLKTVGGFSVPELGRAFLVQTATVAQRLLRARQRLKHAGAELEIPAPRELPARTDAVLEVVYLMFNEGRGLREPSWLQLAAGAFMVESRRRVPGVSRLHPSTESPQRARTRSCPQGAPASRGSPRPFGARRSVRSAHDAGRCWRLGRRCLRFAAAER